MAKIQKTNGGDMMDDLQFMVRKNSDNYTYKLELLGEYNDWKYLVNDIENLITETDGIILKRHFQSIYNSYVEYEYEPFTTGGFKLYYDLSFENETSEQFFEYLLQDRVDTLNDLNRQFTLEV